MGLIEPPEVVNRHRLTVDEHHRMAEAGVLAPDARVALIDGEIIDMAPIGTRHGSAVLRLTQLLLIEVSDSTARYDREIKLPLYARHLVAEVWIVDLDAGVLRCFSRPQGGIYVDGSETGTPGSLTPLALPGVAIDMDGVLA